MAILHCQCSRGVGCFDGRNTFGETSVINLSFDLLRNSEGERIRWTNVFIELTITIEIHD